MFENGNKIKHLSVSQVRSWQWCPLRWWRERMAEPPAPFQTTSVMAMGSAFHRAVEAHHRGRDPYDRLFSEWTLLKERYDDAPPEGRRIAFDGLDMYIAAVGREEGERPEERFKVEIPELPVPFIGVIDLRRGDRLVEIKTGRANWGQAKVNADLQATAYAYANNQLRGVLPAITFVSVRTSFSARLVQMETTRTEADLAKFEGTVRKVYGEMLAATEETLTCQCGKCAAAEVVA